MSIKSLFEDIADAIREKSGSSDTYTPAEMPSAIRSIPSGSGTASGVSYDNTSSGLTASNVQDAIDELSGDLSTINSDLSEINSNLSENNFDNPVELSAYSQSSPYLVPRDGYVSAYSRTGEVGWIYIIGNNGVSSIYIGSDDTGHSSCCTFVRKGMKLWAVKTGNAETRFYPLV